MIKTLNPEDVRKPYTSKTRAGVLWWVAHIGSLLSVVAADALTVWALWKFTDNLSGGYKQIVTALTTNIEGAFMFIGVLYAIAIGHYVWKRIMRSLATRASDSIPGVYGVVEVDKLPGLGWGDFWVGFAPRIILSTAFLITISLLGASPIIVALGLTTYSLQTCRHAYLCAESAVGRLMTAGTCALAFSVVIACVVIINVTAVLDYEGWMTWFFLMAMMAVFKLLGFSLKSLSAPETCESRSLGGMRYMLKSRSLGTARLSKSS